ncbi:MAG: hypothetical protein J7K66_04270 [Anaerolineaceae bacterium]|nr:hypothetical protein [Anaerolineaceae bacterium]
MGSKKKENIKVQRGVILKAMGFAYLKIAVISIIFGSIFLVIGLWLDQLYGKYPIFTISFMVISFPVSLLINIKIIKNSIEKHHL